MIPLGSRVCKHPRQIHRVGRARRDLPRHDGIVTADVRIQRESTAMRRTSWSRPVSLGLTHNVIREDLSFFDYGCGHGDDLAGLEAMGIRAQGWDPYHRPDVARVPSDVINLGFVLNVIEDPSERADVLRSAYALATKTLIVSVRVDRSLSDAESFGDGVLTKRNTFQKLYT